jgi:hypothetical protein
MTGAKYKRVISNVSEKSSIAASLRGEISRYARNDIFGMTIDVQAAVILTMEYNRRLFCDLEGLIVVAEENTLFGK